MFKFFNKIKKLYSIISLQLGRKVVIGNNIYRTKGIYLNRITLNDDHEPWLDLIYNAALAAKHGAFIDVGANSGQTLMKILSLDKNIEYVGFEPQLDCCYYIDQFIRKNSLSSHLILPVGLSNTSKVVLLFKRTDDMDTTASTVDGFRPTDFYSSKQAIYVTSGDKIISDINLSAISTIKIDVEGGELEVIDGLKNTFSEYKPFVIFEVLNNFLVVTDSELDKDTIKFRMNRIEKMENILRDAGYKLFNILPDDGLVEVSKIEPCVSNDLRITDYIAIHKDYRSNFFDKYKGMLQS